MKSSGRNISLTSYDDLFSTEEIREARAREQIQQIPLPELYPFKDHPFRVVDDDRMKLRPGEKIEHKSVRFRTLGCYPLTGGCESTATTLDEIIDETLSAVSSERTTRVIDNEAAGSMERRKREGYF